MKLVIDISEDDFGYIYDRYADGDSPDEKSLTDTVMYAIANGKQFPDNATNGDIIKTLFPHISVKDNCQKYYSVDIENLSKDIALNTIGFRKEWWDAQYKASDTDGNS